MSNLISKNDFYSRLLERSKSFGEKMGDMERNRDVLKHNLNVLIDLCDKRLVINDDYHNSDGNHNNDYNDSDTDERSLNGRQSEQTLENCIESGEKWLNKIKTSKGQRIKCVFNDCHSLTVFKNKTDALAHVWGHTGHRPYKCGESGCGYSARWKSRVKEHSRQRHSRKKPHKCPIINCDYRTAKQSNLKPHMKAKHNDNNDSDHNSDNHDSDTDESCLNERQSDQTLEECIERSEKWIIKTKTSNGQRFKCVFNDCHSQTVFSKKDDALAHVWGHTGHRPYKCGESGCDYSGRWKSRMKRHSLTHTRVMPIKCANSGCDNDDNSNSCDSDSNEENDYQCCKKENNNDQTIEESIERAKKFITIFKENDKIHYNCSFDRRCTYNSNSITTVVQHVWTHTDERPFKCHHIGCDYASRYKGHLYRHQSSHHLSAKSGQCDESDSDYHRNRRVNGGRNSKAKRSARGDRLYECGETGCRYSTKVWHHYREHINCHVIRVN